MAKYRVEPLRAFILDQANRYGSQRILALHFANRFNVRREVALRQLTTILSEKAKFVFENTAERWIICFGSHPVLVYGKSIWYKEGKDDNSSV